MTQTTSNYMTLPELRELSGYQKAASIIGWLKGLGVSNIRFNRYGQPIVHRTVFDKALGAHDNKINDIEPDFSKLDG